MSATVQRPSYGSRVAERTADAILGNRYQDDPVGWTRDKRGAFVWSKQVEILESVRDNRFTACHSMHGTGKSWTAADAVAWWIDAHPVGQAFAVTTAPTSAQVDAILWREIGAAQTEMDLDGYVAHGGYPKWMIGKQMVAYGRKPTDYADPTKAMQAFQGIHAKYVLVVLDEACGIPRWLWDAVDTLVTNELSRVLAIGNPDDPASHFATVCAPGSGWNTIHVGAEHLPYVTGEEIPEELTHVITGPTWVEEREKRWGLESPLYISKVLGLFPDIADDTLISPRLIREARERELAGLGKGRYGADIARFGKDETIVYRNRDGQIRLAYKGAKNDTMKTAGAFAKILRGHVNQTVPMIMDIIGVGAGVYDRLREQGLNVYPFTASERAYEPERFLNRRAEVYWNFREALEESTDEEGIDLDVLDDDLASQLQTIKWFTNSKGQIYIESKDDMAKRGLPSPDRADACVISDIKVAARLEAEEQLDDEPDLASDLLERAF